MSWPAKSVQQAARHIAPRWGLITSAPRSYKHCTPLGLGGTARQILIPLKQRGTRNSALSHSLGRRTVNLIFEFIGEKLPQMRMRLDQPGYIAQVFDSFTLSSR